MTPTNNQPGEIDLDRLEARAKAATPGKWLRNRTFGQLNIQDAKYMLSDADAVFIAEANPETVLALISLARSAPPAGAGGDELSAQQIFELATPYFAWNADSWQKATRGTVGMPQLLAFTRAARAAHPIGHAGATVAAEPIYQFSSLGEGNWSDCTKTFFDDCPKYKYHRRIVYAAPASLATGASIGDDPEFHRLLADVQHEPDRGWLHLARFMQRLSARGFALNVAAPASPATQPADWTVDDSELARKIMVFLGHSTTASMEPGADPLRDRLAEKLALWRPATQPAASDAQPGADERALFEAWYGENYTTYLPRMREGKYAGEYVNSGTQMIWHAWQARAALATPPATPGADHEFKNFHRLLCERFGYTHDERDWKRDQLSLIEHIAALATPAVQAGATVAADWQTVPKIPTKAMNAAGYMRNLELGSAKRSPHETYKAMLAAAPVSPATQPAAMDAAIDDGIPAGVYYNPDSRNFYDAKGVGMGWDFYIQWRECRDMFPKSRAAMSASASEADGSGKGGAVGAGDQS